MNASKLMHPRALPSLVPNFYTSRCDIERPTTEVDPATGEPMPTWQIVFASLPCSAAPIVLESVNNSEKRDDAIDYAEVGLRIAIPRYLPGILETDRVKLDDGRCLAIRGIETDSHETMTRLRVEAYR